MESSYYRYDGESQPRPAGPQLVQMQELQHQPQRQQQFVSRLLQHDQQSAVTQAPLLGAHGAHAYLVSPPVLLSEQQQQQQQQGQEQHHQGPRWTPFSVSYSDPPTGAPLGARGWWGEARLAAAAAAAALQQIKQNPIRRALLFVCLFSVLCFFLLHATRQPQTASARLTQLESHGGVCGADYRETTLKLAHEASAFSLLAEGWPQAKFEASDVVASNKSLYFVCDSSFALMKTGFALEPLAPENMLIGTPERNGKYESDWEALWLDEIVRRTSAKRLDRTRAVGEAISALQGMGIFRTGVFYVVREAITHNPDEEDMEAAPKTEEQQRREQQQHQRTGGQGEEGSTKQPFHAHIEEIKLHGNSYVLQTTCKTEFSFSSGNKGFEVCARATSAKEDQGAEPEVLELPSEINFADYSSVTTRGNTIAIASQEDSRMWLGHLNLQERKATSPKTAPTVVLEDPHNLQVLPGGKVLHFPRDDDCNVVYCNIEGIAFINDRMIAAASDKVKKWQEHRCMQKDQSLHVFSLPAGVGN